ncbi:MAG: sodium:calcium antiporter [Aureliella sp.]
MVLAVTFLVLSAVIIVAAIFLAKFVDKIAEQTGMDGSIAGLVLLAGATSLPELSVGYAAIAQGAADLTAGGVLGSSLVNLLILALVDLGFRRRIFGNANTGHELSAVIGALLTGLVLLGIVLDSELLIWRVGPISLAVVIVYFLGARLVFYQTQIQDAGDAAGPETDSDTEQESRQGQGGKSLVTLLLNIVGFLAATAVIYFVAPLLAEKGDEIALVTGLGRTFIGTLLLAGVTSLPEAVSTITAVRIGAVNMAVGNIFGSNACNMLIFAVLDFATTSSLLSAVSETHAITAACAIIVTAVALLSTLYVPRKRLWIIEPDAALIAMLVLGSLYLVFLQS